MPTKILCKIHNNFKYVFQLYCFKYFVFDRHITSLFFYLGYSFCNAQYVYNLMQVPSINPSRTL